MKFPFFASFIVFCIWLGYEIHKHVKLQDQAERDFWEKEVAANNTRRKPLDDLNYIRIPFDTLPMELLADDSVICEYHETLHTLSRSPVVNLSGISNTDLKLKYGAPNIELLSRYDQSYTVLARTLQSWGKALYENGFPEEACTVLEFAVSTCTDIKGTYRLLVTIYKEQGRTFKIPELIPVAESLRSGYKNTIVSMLKAACEESASQLI